jgi:transporter family protein
VDYRILCVTALVFWGVWGFLGKLLSRDMPVATLMWWSSVGSLLPTVLYPLSQRAIHWAPRGEIALLSGLAGGIAVVAFYLALKNGPASVVFPLTGMYLLIPAVLGYVFLHEALTVGHAAGLVCAGAAIFLLSR